ncbi:hypothetical protein C8R43DRAFT_950063 [Mycena crocata]|nr:hypothetical protein C8R43DRAFT_950063 [Mycena crocata]
MGGALSTRNIPADENRTEDRLTRIHQSLVDGLPYSGGAHFVKAQDLAFHYDVDSGNSTRRIDFANPMPTDLSALASACHPTTVGTGGRKILKMDPTKFATRLDLVDSGLIDTIAADILRGKNADGKKSLRAEIQELNIYDSTSVVQLQTVSPRDESIVGCLIVVLPTAHEGGVLTVEHECTTWRFDAAAWVAATALAPTPAIAYVALYGGIAHTMTSIRSGHRVTLTYNLRLVNRNTSVPTSGTTTDRILEDNLRALLAEPAFLPSGGYLACGLTQKYVLPPPQQLDVDWDGDRVEPYYYSTSDLVTEDVPRHAAAARWDAVLRSLQGSDARMRSVSQSLGLVPAIKVLYANPGLNVETLLEGTFITGHDVLLDDVVDLENASEHNPFGHGVILAADEIDRQGVVVQRDERRIDELNRIQAREYARYPDYRDRQIEQVVNVDRKEPFKRISTQWLTDIGDYNRVGSPYVCENGTIEHVYGTAALFIPVPPLGERILPAAEDKTEF